MNKERELLEILRKTNKIICNDDTIIFKGVKCIEGGKPHTPCAQNGNRGAILLSEDYHKYLYKDPQVQYFWQPNTNRTFKADEKIEALKNGALPVHIKRRNLADSVNSFIEVNADHLSLVHNNLYVNFDSRYKIALKSMQDLQHIGMFAPTEDIEEDINNAMWCSRYDWNLLIHDEFICKKIIERLTPHAEHIEPNTLYFSGYNSKKSQLVKIYNMKNTVGVDCLKIEISYRSEFLQKQRVLKGVEGKTNLRDINLWTTQPQIQELLTKAIKSTLKKVFTKANVMQDLTDLFCLKRPNQLLEYVTDIKHTITTQLNEAPTNSPLHNTGVKYPTIKEIQSRSETLDFSDLF